MLPYDAQAYRALLAAYQAEHTTFLLLAVLGLLLAVALGLRRDVRGHRLAAVLLGAAWLWIAWGFHWRHFAGLNFAAPLYAGLFGLQGLLLLTRAAGTGLALHWPGGLSAALGLVLAAAAWIGYPLLDLLEGSGLVAARLPGTAPAPTALFTLALLLAVRRDAWLLVPLPLLACLVAAFSGWVLGMMADRVLAPLALLVPVLLWRRRMAQART